MHMHKGIQSQGRSAVQSATGRGYQGFGIFSVGLAGCLLTENEFLGSELGFGIMLSLRWLGAAGAGSRGASSLRYPFLPVPDTKPQTQHSIHTIKGRKPPAGRPSALFPGLAEDGGELMHGTWLMSFKFGEL